MQKYFFRITLIAILLTSCYGLIKENNTDETPSPIIITKKNVLPASTIEPILCPNTIVPNDIGSIIDGTLIYIDHNGYEPKMMDFENMQEKSLKSKNDMMLSYALSPEGDWLAYEALDSSNSTKQLVIVKINHDPKEYTRVIWKDTWEKIAYWLNNEQVVIKLFPDESYRILLLNPFEETRDEIVASFPNIYTLEWPPDWNGSGPFIFNTNLSTAIYADLGQNYVIWDNLENKNLGFKQARSFTSFPTKAPQWNSDGSQALIAAPENSLKYMNDELFSMHQDGTIDKLTDMTSIFSTVSINRYSWSLDGRYVAMLLSGEPSNFVEQLVILDTSNKALDIYCIEGDVTIFTNGIGYRRNPKGFYDEIIYKGVIWSPDNQQLLIENRVEENKSNIILLDVARQTTYKILHDVNYQPIGWIK